jgi:predicted dehydrogenase
MSPLGVAVLGLGIGRAYIRALQAVADVQVLAVAARDPQAQAQARSEFGVPQSFTDWRAAVDCPGVDVVCVCTPDRLHAEQTLYALDAGKHVFCEKPLTTSLEDAARVVARVRQTGLKLMVGHTYRFVPQFAKLRELLQAGAVGQPFLAESRYVQDLFSMESLGPDYWRFKDPQDFYLGGAVHNVDLLQWLMGDVVEVQAYANHGMPFYPLDDNYVSNYRFASGAIGRVLLALGGRFRTRFAFDAAVHGPLGILSATMKAPEVVEDVDGLVGEGPRVHVLQAANSHGRAVAHFVDCVRQDRQPASDAVAGAKAVAVCLAVIRAAREGRAVAVDYGFL